jgi:hypothetical protein
VVNPHGSSRNEAGTEAARSSRSGPASISDLVADFARAHRLRRPDDRERVFAAWNRVAGKQLARVAWAVRWHHGELLVEVSSAAHMHELSAYRAAELTHALNQTLGSDMVSRLRFKPGVRR